ncbi:MAG: hypothetical protein WA837_16905 [Xanthobacteraceae bacterium]
MALPLGGARPIEQYAHLRSWRQRFFRLTDYDRITEGSDYEPENSRATAGRSTLGLAVSWFITDFAARDED